MTTEEIADRLYGLPLEEFTQARNEAAGELRGEGRREDADAVKALRKPSAAAAAVNRLVREHRRDVERFIDAAAALRDAQLAGKGDYAAAARRQREALEQLTRQGGDQVRQSLLAAAVDDGAAAELLAGRLDRELEPQGFGSLLSHLPAGRAATPPAKPRRDDRAAREKLRAAQQALTAAEADERDARRAWERAQKEVSRAEAAVERARRALDRMNQ